MALLTIQEQEEAYNEILRIYDLAESVIDAVERNGNENPELEIELAKPMIEQMEESADVVSQKFIEFIQKGQKSSKSDVNAIEGAIRKVFTSATDFINKLQQLPTDFAGISREELERVTAMPESVATKIRKGLLPIIGYKAGQLIPGPIREGLTELMFKLPKMKELIFAVRESVGQFFRLTYFFLGLESPLVSNAHNVIWGRKIPDLRAQALLEQEKSAARREKDLTQFNSHSEIIGRNSYGYKIED